MMTGIGMGFGGIGVIILLIIGGTWLVKSLFNSNPSNLSGPAAPRQSSALDILDQRYAHGEISREEYETIKQDL